MLRKLFGVALMMTAASVTSAAVFDVSNPAEFQSALTTAQSNGQNDVINVAAGTYHITSTLEYAAASGEDFTLEILGAGSDLVFLDGQAARSILRIDASFVTSNANLSITVTNMTFSNGNAVGDPSDGGALAILLEPEAFPGADFVRIEGSEFYDNSADGDGGAPGEIPRLIRGDAVASIRSLEVCSTSRRPGLARPIDPRRSWAAQ